MVYFDTESIGFYGPTVLIQWAKDDGPIHIHNIWNRPVIDTLELINNLTQEELCGYNLSHDSFHINRTFNCLYLLPHGEVPNLQDYHDVENKAKDLFCIKPKAALDLLLYGRKGEFQSTLNQKDIVLKKVPKILANFLIKELYEKVEIPDIYFAKSKIGYRWRVVEIDTDTGRDITPEMLAAEKRGEYDIHRDKDFVNLRLGFNPSAALKAVVASIKGTTTKTIDDLRPLRKPTEYAFNPTSGHWIDVAREHINAWTKDTERLRYAELDVEYLRIVHDYFGTPNAGDVDSNLAWAVGAMFWRGFAVDIKEAKKYLAEIDSKINKITLNYNSPKQVLNTLHGACTPLEIQAIPNTKKETLEHLLDWKDDNPHVYTIAKTVLDARRLEKERDVLRKIIMAGGRLHVQYKVIGTKSNRMSGGGESFVSRGGSINPQGVKRDSRLREICVLAHDDMVLCGGDFDAFEVSIAEAEYNDDELRKDLLSGKKMHALFAEAMYGVPYDTIMANQKVSENDEKGWYARGKRGFFGRLYGAHDKKMSQVLMLPEEKIHEGLEKFFERYKNIKRSQDAVYEDHMTLRQPDGIGTKVIYVEPKQYVESFLGFKRFFSLEYSIIKVLFNLAQDLPDEIKNLGNEIKVVRRDRLQTGTGAVRSAIYAAAFNLQSQVMRSAVNHKIQSPGGQITKELQSTIWDLQPVGIKKWRVMPMNIHDEIQCPCRPDIVDRVTETVNEKVNSYRDKVPLISMKWKTHLKGWADK